MKKRNASLLLFGVLGAALLAFGCASNKMLPGNETLIGGCKEKPKWVKKPAIKNTKEAKAFMGVSFRHSTERMAMRYAETDVKNKIIDSLWGSYGRNKVREVFSRAGITDAVIDDGTARDEMLEWKSKGYVRYDVAEYCTQEWQRVDETGQVRKYFKTWVLVMVDRDVMKRFLTDTLKAQKIKERKREARKNIDRALGLMKKMSTKDFEDW